MKIVINRCFGGFGLSPLAIKRLAELNGRECYFFTNRDPESGEINLRQHFPTSIDEIGTSLFFSAFDIPNPDEAIPDLGGSAWARMTSEEKAAHNALYSKHSLNSRPEDRADPKLIQVIEELGKAANGRCSDIAIVEIPDGVSWEIDEYDGNETIDEVHRSWR